MTWRSRILIVALAVTVLPSARRAPAEEAFVDPWANLDQVEITLQADGELEISGRSYDRDLLKKALRWRFKSQPQQEVLVYANPAAQLVTVLDVLQLVRNAGFKDVDLYSLQKNRSGHRRDDSFPEEIELVEEVEPVEIIEEVGIGATDLIEEVEVLEEAPSTVDEWAAWVAPSVRASLSWLAFSQHPEGYWDADRWGGDGAQDVGVTALAVLAFLGDGQTQRDGPHSAAVRRALHWLIDGQDERGLLQRKRSIHQMYCHAIATLALAEAYHLSSDENLREPAQEAVHAIHRARNPYRAWRYGELPDGDNDVSISGWMLIALFAARDAGLEVDRAALRDGMKYIHDMTDPRNGRTGYTSKGSPPARNVDALEQWPTEHSESMTALAMFTRILNGESPAHSIPLRQGSDLLKAKPPTWNVQTGQIDYYYWYFGLASLWQMGGPAWNLWQHNALEALIPHQHTAGDLQGSWDSHVDPWGTQGGRVYATALNSLSLQVCQRYQHLSR
jgi:biopolymer transport protein ExbD